jgi:hypothetical protein
VLLLVAGELVCCVRGCDLYGEPQATDERGRDDSGKGGR